MTLYQERIKQLEPDYDPRHIEGYIRLEHSTLDGLSKSQFKEEVEIATECIKEGGEENAEKNAKSFGL